MEAAAANSSSSSNALLLHRAFSSSSLTYLLPLPRSGFLGNISLHQPDAITSGSGAADMGVAQAPGLGGRAPGEGAESGAGMAEEGPPSSLQETVLQQDIQEALAQWVIPALCGLGVLGNALSLLVLCRTKFRKTDGQGESGSHLGLIALAISDSFFCVALFPKAFTSPTDSLFRQRGFKLYYQVYGTGVVTTFLLTSTWITVAMALLRYVNICHPFRSRRLDGLKCAKIVYPLVSAACALLNIPSFMQYTVTDIELAGRQLYLIDLGYMAASHLRGQVFQWVRAVAGIFLPALLLVFFNCSLIRALKQSQRMRLNCFVKETPTQRSRKWITVTLIVIAIAFILLVLPSELLDFFHHRVRRDVTKTETFILTRAVTNTLQVFNFAFNFVLYFVINIHFRKSLREMCDCTRALAALHLLRGGVHDARRASSVAHTTITQRTLVVRRISSWKTSTLTVV